MTKRKEIRDKGFANFFELSSFGLAEVRRRPDGVYFCLSIQSQEFWWLYSNVKSKSNKGGNLLSKDHTP